jgi:antitoxin component of MazEF toxin-antitoxin module
MGFSFLAPLFLAGAAAIAIPILIHLTHRERKDALAFPSLMFISQIPYKTHRRQKIRHWLLFLMRTLAIVLVAAAFARPLLDDSGRAAQAFAGARELVVLLDNSHSMAYGDRWDRAVTAGRRAVDAVGPDDRVTLITFSEQAEALTQRTSDTSLLLAALSRAEVSFGVTRFGSALELAREIVERSDRPRSEVLLISDFQRTGWDARQAVRLPEGTVLTQVDLSDPNAVNLAVSGAAIARTRSDRRELVTISAQLANLGTQRVEDVGVSLEVDGEQLQVQPLSLEPGETSVLRFSSFVAPARSVSGVIRAGSDALPADNEFRFVVSPADPISILIVEPRAAGPDHTLYLRQALGIGGDPGFVVDVRNLTRLSAADLEGRKVVVLNDAPFPGGAIGGELRDWVSDGGGLLAVLGRRSPPGAWPAEGIEFLPVAFGGPADRSSAGGGTLSSIEYEHPVFELFRTPRSGDFSGARFFRYRRMDAREGVRVLARFDDGGSALAEGRRGEGRVLVWASDFQNFWNDLAVQPLFLPFTHRLMTYLSGYVEPETWFRVGDVIDLSQNPMFGGDVIIDEPEIIIESPIGDPVVLQLDRGSRFVRLDEAGFYQIRFVENRDDRAYVAAANLDPRESDLTALDPEELAGAVTAQGDGEAATLEAVLLSPEDRERRQGLWWYLLVGACGLLLLETLLSNRVSRTARARA